MGTTRDEIVEAFQPLIKSHQSPEHLNAYLIVKNPASFVESPHNSYASLNFTDKYAYEASINSPKFVKVTGNASYAFANCASGIIQNLEAHVITDEQFSMFLCAILNGMDRDSRTWYFLPADYQVADGNSKGRAVPKNTFLWRMIHELGALKIDETPNMFHPPSMAVMYRLCFLYNPNILKFVYCKENRDSWEHGTHMYRHFNYYPKHLVDAAMEELAKPKVEPVPKKETKANVDKAAKGAKLTAADEQQAIPF